MSRFLAPGMRILAVLLFFQVSHTKNIFIIVAQKTVEVVHSNVPEILCFEMDGWR